MPPLVARGRLALVVAALLALAATFALGAAAERRAPGLLAAAPATPASLAPGRVFEGPFEARVVRVVDGDTFAARLTIWFGLEIETLVRLRGVDAPELGGRCAPERAQATAARDSLGQVLESGRVLVSRVGGDKYFGRVTADVAVVAPDGAFPPVDVAALLQAEGLARPYAGRARGGWCDLAAAPRLKAAASPSPCRDARAGSRRRRCAAPAPAPRRRRRNRSAARCPE